MGTDCRGTECMRGARIGCFHSRDWTLMLYINAVRFERRVCIALPQPVAFTAFIPTCLLFRQFPQPIWAVSLLAVQRISHEQIGTREVGI